MQVSGAYSSVMVELLSSSGDQCKELFVRKIKCFRNTAKIYKRGHWWKVERNATDGSSVSSELSCKMKLGCHVCRCLSVRGHSAQKAAFMQLAAGGGKGEEGAPSYHMQKTTKLAWILLPHWQWDSHLNHTVRTWGKKATFAATDHNTNSSVLQYSLSLLIKRFWQLIFFK